MARTRRCLPQARGTKPHQTRFYSTPLWPAKIGQDPTEIAQHSCATSDASAKSRALRGILRAPFCCNRPDLQALVQAWRLALRTRTLKTHAEAGEFNRARARGRYLHHHALKAPRDWGYMQLYRTSDANRAGPEGATILFTL